MARFRGPRLKIIRRLGTPIPGLMRTDGDLRRPYPPGQHGPTRRAKLSDYALRLREKQKLRFHYGLSEKKLIKYVKKAFRTKGNPGIALLTMLESRLDNIVFRAGFSPTIRASRQMTRHGHVTVNGKKVDIPSFKVNAGDEIAVYEKSNMKEQIAGHMKDPQNLANPSYLDKVDENVSAKMITAPNREDIPVIVNEQLIVEFYSGM